MKLENGRFVANPYDPCILNKLGADGVQITSADGVDDLLVSSARNDNLASLERYLQSGTYFTVPASQWKIVCGTSYQNAGWLHREPHLQPKLFDVRNNVEKASSSEAACFHTYVAKILYLAKRMRPECLTAVSFLTTRVHDCDIDDMAKLKRL